jgi:flagellar hook-associated protein 2
MALTVDTSTRLTGMASGLDTESIIKGLMTGYQTQLDKQSQSTTKLQWKADAYREINTLIKNFRAKSLSVLSGSNMMSASAYDNYMVNMLTTTNAVSVSASSSASACSMNINSITQLATAAATSSKDAFTGTTYQSDTTLANLQLANKFTFDESGELSFTINDKTFTFTGDTTIAAMMKEINSSDAGVTIKYSSLSKGFSITSDVMGSASAINIVNLKGNAFATDPAHPENSALGIAQNTYKGTDAICTINGIEVTQSTNTFTYDGITYTLNNTFNTSKDSSQSIAFSVNQDYQKTADSIKAFIDSYNELVDAIQSKVSEDVYYDYDPLTDDQKEEMSDTEIENWEEKA